MHSGWIIIGLFDLSLSFSDNVVLMPNESFLEAKSMKTKHKHNSDNQSTSTGLSYRSVKFTQTLHP